MFRQLICYSIMIIGISLGLALIMASPAFAEDLETGGPEMTLKATGSEDGIPLKATDVDGSRYFFLPSGVKEENMECDFGEEVPFKMMQSDNIASVHFFSSNPAKGRDYVHEDKDHKAPGEVYMFDENFELLYHGDVDALKGRGNTTWKFSGDKKSYQMKLEKKADLLDPVKGKQKAKKWLLLGNPFDPTLIRNDIILNFSKELGIDSTPEGRPVDYYYDGEYRGSYYLCEKVEVGDHRVEIHDLEADVEKANPGVDFEKLKEAKAKTSKGFQIKYEKGVTSPSDITGGYLIELDDAYYMDEKSWARYSGKLGSPAGKWPHVAVSKSPEYLSKKMADYIGKKVYGLFNYAWSESSGFKDGKKLSKYIDVDSLARYILVTEWFDVQDAWISSTYLYKDKDDDVLHAGPIWDCDSSMQIRWPERLTDTWFTKGTGTYLLGLPTVRKAMQNIYKKEMRTLIYENLLGTKKGKYLRPAEYIREELAASAEMNYMIWDINDCLGSYYPADTVEGNYEDIMNWMESRAAWFDKQIMSDGFVPNHMTVSQVKTVKASPNASKHTCRITIGKTKVNYSNPGRQKSVNARNYQILYRQVGSKWKKVKMGGKRTYTLKKVAKGGVYEVKARAAAKRSSSKFGKYSAVQRIFIGNVSPKLKAGKKKVTVRWSKTAKAGGYQIRISTNKSMKGGTIIHAKAKTRTIGKLKSGKRYYVQMRAYRVVKGKTYFTGWSSVKSVKVR